MRKELHEVVSRHIQGLLRSASSLRKVAMLSGYRGAESDILCAGRWSLLTGPVARPMFLMSVWNPMGQRTSQAANARTDAHFVCVLRRFGVTPIRTRGHDVVPPEYGWMIAHKRERSLALLRAYGQVAGIIMRGEEKHVLWVDGSLSALT